MLHFCGNEINLYSTTVSMHNALLLCVCVVVHLVVVAFIFTLFSILV